MKMRCVFLTHKKQIEIPKGWSIGYSQVIEKKGQKPQFMLLLVHEEEAKSGTKLEPAIGFHMGSGS